MNAAAGGGDGEVRRFSALLARPRVRYTLKVYAWIGIGLATYFAAVWGLAWALGVGYKVSLFNNLALAGAIYAICLVLGLLARLAWIMLVRRPRRLFRHLADDFTNTLFSLERLILALPVLVGMPVAMSLYSSLKRMIPDLVPYRYDEAFWQIDRWLHFGHDPWEWLQPLLATPATTSAISTLYHEIWLLLMLLIWIWQACSLARPHLRLQFLITYLLVWVLLGNVGAVALSSAGPVYYAEVTGLSSPYRLLFEYLYRADGASGVSALKLQEMLWASLASGGRGVGTGISAMPSVHVATTVVFALLAANYSRILGLLFAAYVTIVVVGSVHLGWHYAIDAYVSIVSTVALWRLVGAWLERTLPIASGRERD